MARTWARLAALILLPLLGGQSAPPAADTTAIYVAPHARVPMRIEAAANGDLRVEQGDDRYLLSHDGHDYLVMAGAGGPVVMRVEDIVAARARPKAGHAAPIPQLVAAEDFVVNGRHGTVYSVDPRPAGGPYIVISHDPALAAVGRAFARQYQIDMLVSPGPEDGTIDLRPLFASGAPLRFGNQDLRSVRTGPIPPSRFELPAPPETAESVRDMFGSDDAEPSPATADRTTFNRAIFTEGRLWLLSDSGKLLTIAPGDKAAADRPAPEPVLDLCLAPGGPVALTAASDGPWTMRRFANGGWSTLETVAPEGDRLIALSCTGSRRTILTDKRLIDFGDEGRRGVHLSEPLRAGVVATTHDAGAAFYLGIDAGEWGGGLRRIDRQTGAVTTIERKAHGDRICPGPLVTGCDPVNGIAPEPGKPDCLVVAIGLVHMAPHGRLAEVCGTRVAALFYKPYTLQVAPRLDLTVPEPFETVAFYGLAQSRGVLWAVGLDGLYRIGADGHIGFTRMPRFENAGGISLSLEIPELVLVRTSINQRVALSGAVPMIVPR